MSVLSDITADKFIEKLKTLCSEKELEKIQRYFKTDYRDDNEEDIFIGVRMGQVFDLAKEFMKMTPDHIENLLESSIHEVRVGAVSIMDFQARDKRTSESRKKELFDLYITRHDRINNWDLVDRSAPYVVGGYLSDKPRDILYELAVSKNWWERRTAIVATYFFIRKGQLEDTFEIAEILINDENELVQKALGGWLREAGKQDTLRLLAFLNEYAATMPRTALRYTLEKLTPTQRKYYLEMKSRLIEKQ